MSSQGSDRLKAILAEAKEKARAAQAAQGSPAALAETRTVEALLDRNEALPDPRALSRLYRNRELVERLPEDEDGAPVPGATPKGPPTTTVYRPPAGVVAPPSPAPSAPTEPEAKPAPPRPEEPSRPPLSPAQIREVMNELKEQFAAGSYETFAPKPLPVDVIPMTEEPEDEVAALEEPSEIFYILGAVLAMVVIGVFVFLALNGPLRYRPPAATPTPAASPNR